MHVAFLMTSGSGTTLFPWAGEQRLYERDINGEWLDIMTSVEHGHSGVSPQS
jgi:hypothetical protein